MGDNTHPLDDPNVLTDEILIRNGAATVPDEDGKLPQAQVSKLAVGGDGVADDVKQDGARLPVDPAAQGTWDYRTGDEATEAITGRVLSIDVLSGPSGATVSINGGTAITIPADVSFGVPIYGRLVSPTIVFSGSVLYFVQIVV